MARVEERPTITEEETDDLWDNIEGEAPDSATAQALKLAHRASEKFPRLTGKYHTFAGPAVIASGALVALAGVAVARRLRRGQQPDDILDEITEDEIERAATATSRHNRIWRMVVRIARRRRDQQEASAGDSP
ncbi:MAG: hypothetical protein WBD55_03175 [Dehalococcoidia bacterium]